MPRGRFSGKVAVVTGGAGGLGRVVCAGFTEEGARVAVLDQDADAAQAAAAALRPPGNAAGWGLDVRDPTATASVMSEIHQRWGRIDVLVTLAGGSLGTATALADIRPDDVDLVVDVNVKGTLFAVQAVAPLMRAGGSIITISSIGGRQPSPVTGVPYAASKAAVTGLTRRLAREVGAQGIRVNSVAPGLFLTPRLAAKYAAMPAPEREEVLDAIALSRLPELTEIVGPILFLASEDASYITGITLDVNGGRYMPL